MPCLGKEILGRNEIKKTLTEVSTRDLDSPSLALEDLTSLLTIMILILPFFSFVQHLSLCIGILKLNIAAFVK